MGCLFQCEIEDVHNIDMTEHICLISNSYLFGYRETAVIQRSVYVIVLFFSLQFYDYARAVIGGAIEVESAKLQ